MSGCKLLVRRTNYGGEILCYGGGGMDMDGSSWQIGNPDNIKMRPDIVMIR